MRQIVYKCDNCKKLLSADGKGKQHLSIEFYGYSGWVIGEKDKTWRHKTMDLGIKQFCNGKCLGDYFDKQMKQAKKNENKAITNF